MRAFILSFLLILAIGQMEASPCAFCKEEVIQLQSVYTTEHFNILLDYEPQVYGHILVVPKRDVVKAHDLSQEEWSDLFLVIPKVVKGFTQFLHTDQYILLEKNGPDAYQDVPHVHFDLLPMTRKMKLKDFFLTKRKKLTLDELKKEVFLFRNYFSS